MDWKVVALHKADAVQGLKPVDHLEVEAGEGFVGDRHYGRRQRQSLFVSTESLSQLGLKPGDLIEQVTVEMPGLQQMKPGARFEVGSVLFEIEQECEPCSGMAKRLGEDPEEFKARAAFKRGMFAKALSNGTIRVGDSVSRFGEKVSRATSP